MYWTDRIPHGDHFAAFEQPTLFVAEVRNFARLIRRSCLMFGDTEGS